MIISTTTEVIAKCLSRSEGFAVREFFNAIKGEEKGKICIKTLSATNSITVAALRKLEIVGIIKTRSLGVKGTNYQILNMAALQDVVRNLKI
ncbi:hypothetical protein CN692_18765 [Bacillus sp. AFS002410]|uniref:hypothetical protein n=1 Tax=Bacillus sp. AFS002410 TaxID=2033481 RepID=UPI000BF1100D|nr:hypothetical protein [Bacillus sp. AFS002410]PEJ56170.1 hypothetical protein CN692_18765 [Bacillus sp. AFS002410]